MCSSVRRLVAAALCLGLAGCARQTDARTRRAFGDARSRAQRQVGGQSETLSGGGGGEYTRQKLGWARVSELLDHAVATMRLSPGETELAELAAQWCAVDPEPRKTEQGVVQVCNPDPPVIAGGTSFSLELGGEGVIGLVAADLSSAGSERLARQARAATRSLCQAPWTPAPSPLPTDPTFFHTCPAPGGPLVAVGRFPHRPGSERWLVSVAVLSPG